MGNNNFDDSGAMDLTRNIVIMSIIAIFTVIIFIIFVHFYSKRHQQSVQESSNRVCQQQRGLDASILETIRVINFDPKEFKEGLECAVCLSEVEEGEEIRVLPKCDHGFHVECIDMWFYSHSTCPICRNPMNIVDQTEITVEEQEFEDVSLRENDVNNHSHQSSSSAKTASSSSPSSSRTYINREIIRDLVIDIPPRDCNEEDDEKNPVSCSGMRSLKRILSGGTRLNLVSPTNNQQ